MSTSIFETTAIDLRNLDEEHAEICRRYEGLEEVILRQGSMHSIHRILAAADSLAQMMLLHFTHEEQFLLKLPLSSHLRKKLSDANMEVTDQLSGIKAELEQGKIAPVFQLLRLSKVWIKEHVHLESEGGECESFIEKDRPFLVRRALVDHPSAITGLNR
jgi:hemerythrin